jgi:opacity protein-like surface antigen
MLRKSLLGFAAAAAVGGIALISALPAQAQGWSVTVGSGYGGGHFRHDDRPFRGHGFGGHGFRGDGFRGDGWGRHGFHGGGWRGHPGWGGPHHVGGYGGPRCFVRKVRYWDGWGWTVERRRICH